MNENITTDSNVCAMAWENNEVHLLDQRLLPREIKILDFDNARDLADAIRDMVVRGAPAIGITAAYGVVLAARDAYAKSGDSWRETIQPDLEYLSQARPTAVNLFWALQEMQILFDDITGDPVSALLARAQQIHEQDIAANRRMGDYGVEVIGQAESVLTHCNAGALATGGYGTALGVIRTAYSQQRIQSVYACETRPWLQGARLTAWELKQDNIPVTLIADSAASHLFKERQVQWVIVGADRIAANGDVANKIGTYNLAISARYHGVKFMVAAPLSTIDLNTASGDDIPIESRPETEVLQCGNHTNAPAGVPAFNPAFDRTPAALIDVIVTEKGVVEQPDQHKIKALFSG